MGAPGWVRRLVFQDDVPVESSVSFLFVLSVLCCDCEVQQQHEG